MAVLKYPAVVGEFETIKKIKKGFSISRLGDGEWGVMKGGSTSRQEYSDALAKEMRNILIKPNPKCLVGIPTMDPKGSKYSNIEPSNGKVVGWARHKPVYCQYLSPHGTYYSAFISRPDCGEWMMTLEYAELVASMWLGKRVAVIGPAGTKILRAIQFTNIDVGYIECKVVQAYEYIKDYERAALASVSERGTDLIVISGGMMATCLANRLSPHVQAIDIGSIGGFLVSAFMNGEVKYEKQPKIKTEARA